MNIRMTITVALALAAGTACVAAVKSQPVATVAPPLTTRYITVPNRGQACSGPISCGAPTCTMRCTGDVEPLDCVVLDCEQP
jgi:hypothetical protein